MQTQRRQRRQQRPTEQQHAIHDEALYSAYTIHTIFQWHNRKSALYRLRYIHDQRYTSKPLELNNARAAMPTRHSHYVLCVYVHLLLASTSSVIFFFCSLLFLVVNFGVENTRLVTNSISSTPSSESTRLTLC